MATNPHEGAPTRTWRPRLPSSGKLAYLIGGLVFVGALLGAEFNHQIMQRELQARARADALGFASALRAGIERELNADLYLSSGLASYLSVRHSSLDQAEVGAILAHLFRDSRHIRNLGIAIGYRLSYVYPLAGNEQSLGLHYPDHPEQWAAVQRAIDSDRGTLAGPVALVQGGEGFVYRQPLRIDGRYWGLLSTVIDSSSLLQGAVRDLQYAPYSFAIRGRDGLGQAGDVFVGDAALFQAPAAVSLEVAVPNGSWVLAVKPRAAPPGSRIALTLRIMGWGLAGLLAFAATVVLRHRFEMTRLALLDPLTALPNRRYFERALTRALERSPRQCALLFVDLDHFKAVNDKFGHKAGDIILKTVGERISALIRHGDTVARWGGDELVVMVEETSPEDLARLAERLREAVEQPVEHEGRQLRVGASIGYALAPTDGATPRELLKMADQRMYQQKQQRHPDADPALK
jgi:diguanylate cyclase (GGDEF)-like protein